MDLSDKDGPEGVSEAEADLSEEDGPEGGGWLMCDAGVERIERLLNVVHTTVYMYITHYTVATCMFA